MASRASSNGVAVCSCAVDVLAVGVVEGIGLVANKETGDLLCSFFNTSGKNCCAHGVELPSLGCVDALFAARAGLDACVKGVVLALGVGVAIGCSDFGVAGVVAVRGTAPPAGGKGSRPWSEAVGLAAPAVAGPAGTGVAAASS